jgi:hypothetical protein
MEPAAQPPEIQRLFAALLRQLVEMAPALGGALGGTELSLAVGGSAGALAGAGTWVVVEQVLSKVWNLRSRRARQAAERAAAEAGLSAEELLRRILADERLLDLAIRVFTVAAESALQAKIRAAGKALGRAVRDDATINQERFIVDSLAGLDMPHFLVLEQVYEDYEDYGTPRSPDGTPRAYGWTVHALVARLPGLAPVLKPLLAVLSSRNLVENTAVGTLDYRPGGTGRWILTEYGRDVVHWLEHSQEQDDAAPDASAQDPSEG